MSGENAPGHGLLRVALTYRGDVAWLTLAGELDIAGVPRFEALVASAFVMADRCVVDLAEVTFVDSTGIRALLRAHRRAIESGATLELANSSAAVGRVLSDAGLENVLGDA
jgi:anti-sigma B factor antagonist